MDFQISEAPRRLVAGLAVRTSNAEEMDPGRGRLPGLWSRAARDGDMVAVLTDYASDQDGEYTQLVGREIDTIDDVREGELVAQIPAGRYAVFDTVGEAPASIVDGWGRVWRAQAAGALQRAWATDFELWPAGGSPQIFVSIAP